MHCLAGGGRERVDYIVEVWPVSDAGQADVIKAGIEIYPLKEEKLQAV